MCEEDVDLKTLEDLEHGAGYDKVKTIGGDEYTAVTTNISSRELRQEVKKWIKELQSDLDEEDRGEMFPMDAVDFIKHFFNIDE